MKILRVLRVLRPLRAINRAKGLKVSAGPHYTLRTKLLLLLLLLFLNPRIIIIIINDAEGFGKKYSKMVGVAITSDSRRE